VAASAMVTAAAGLGGAGAFTGGKVRGNSAGIDRVTSTAITIDFESAFGSSPTYAGAATATTGIAASDTRSRTQGRPGAPRSIARKPAKNMMPTATHSASGWSWSSEETSHTRPEATTIEPMITMHSFSGGRIGRLASNTPVSAGAI